MKYTQIPTDTFKKLQLNAGILLTTFDPTTATVTPANIIGATSGGVKFAATPAYTDYGDDIDNVPTNTWQLKRVDSWDVKMSGTMVSADTAVAKLICGAAEVSGNKVTPSMYLSEDDFEDIWWVGDYSDENNDTKGGFIAIKLIKALSTGGFSLQSGKKAKGQFAFEFTGHYDLNDQDTVPFEIYVKAGEAA